MNWNENENKNNFDKKYKNVHIAANWHILDLFIDVSHNILKFVF